MRKLTPMLTRVQSLSDEAISFQLREVKYQQLAYMYIPRLERGKGWCSIIKAYVRVQVPMREDTNSTTLERYSKSVCTCIDLKASIVLRSSLILIRRTK